jgi:tRNA (guanine9-N1)-methyltransferase
MGAEERPLKIRKLSHDDNAQQSSPDKNLNKAWSEEVVDIQEAQSEENEKIAYANGTSTKSSLLGVLENLEGQSEASRAPLISPQNASSAPDSAGLSKNQLKKLRKKQEWEAGREERKLIRKEKNKDKKARKRAARDAAAGDVSLPNGESPENGQDMSSRSSPPPGALKHVHGTLLPITLIIDCAFDDLMHERERISLGSQITRAYSDNHRAPLKAHLVISSWGGELRKRFDTVLNEHYKNWKGVRVLEEDFVAAAEKSSECMSDAKGGKLAGAFTLDTEDISPSDLKARGEVIYLTSDSDNTLDRLKPYSTYIIGGLVDKNRHKGICYKSACDRGIKTAKLPIGEYMEMQSRYVLATNHVVEIMIRWLECGDWGEAFLKVMPKRKGGKLKQRAGGSENGGGKEEDNTSGTDEYENAVEHKVEGFHASEDQSDGHEVRVAKDEKGL